MTPSEPILEVRDLVKHFPVGGGGLFGGFAGLVRAVDGVSFSIRRGETLGLVGESGCGKTTTGRCILQLERPTAGEVIFEGQELTRLSPAELRPVPREVAREGPPSEETHDAACWVADRVGQEVRA